MLLRRVIGDALRARRQAQHRTLREVSTAANVSLGYLSEIERGQKEASSELLAAICEALGAALHEVLRDVTDTLALAEEVRGLVPVGNGRALVPVGTDGAAASGAGPVVPAPSAPSDAVPAASSGARAAFDDESFVAEPFAVEPFGAESFVGEPVGAGAGSHGPSSLGQGPHASASHGPGALGVGSLAVGALGAGSVTAGPASVGNGTPDATVSVPSATLSVAVHHDGPLRTTLRASRANRELEPAAA